MEEPFDDKQPDLSIPDGAYSPPPNSLDMKLGER